MDHKALEHMRKLAVKRVVEGGEAPSEVMRSLGLCRTAVSLAAQVCGSRLGGVGGAGLPGRNRN